MSPVEAKLVEAWREFKTHAETQMGYTNTQNAHECINGAGAFVDFLLGRRPRMGTSYATAPRWSTS